ncbi:MAG: nitroreductase family protein [Candidatus Bathyarchaeota archaeon]|nr:nitroreductase family protein [Candidatus Bathyarchaeota archaeon]
MDVLEAIRTRRSIRKFRPKPVPDEKLKTILEAGLWHLQRATVNLGFSLWSKTLKGKGL